MYRPLVKPLSYIKSFKNAVRVGIVGSRNYGSKWLVELFVKELPAYVTVVSGYGGMVDKTAIDTAKRMRMKYTEHKPDRLFRKRVSGLARNKLIAQDNLRCLIAFMDTDRSSGTVKTIQYALKEKVRVFIIKTNPLDPRPIGRRPKCIVVKRRRIIN